MRRSSFWIFVAFCLLVVGCKNAADKDALPKKISAKSFAVKTQKSVLDYKTLSAKAAVKFQDKAYDQSFKANMKMVKDSIIWLSLTGPFGIEGARALITTDSVKVISRLERKYYAYPLSYIQRFVPTPLSVGQLQQLLLGDGVLALNQDFSNPAKPERTKAGYQIQIEDSQFLQTLLFDPKTFINTNNEIEDKGQNNRVQFTQSDIKRVDGHNFAFKKRATFKQASNFVQLDMNFSKFELNPSLKLSFKVPKNYKRN